MLMMYSENKLNYMSLNKPFMQTSSSDKKNRS